MSALKSKSFAVLALSVLTAGLLPVLLFPALYGPDATGMAAGAACPFRLTSQFEQWIVIVTAFGIKPAYMLISLGLIVWLWRSVASDLSALRWGLILFLAGESACAFNYVALGGGSELWEFLHDYGMVTGFSFVAWAVLEGLDRRIIKFDAAQDRCAALSLCRRCVKYDATAPCGLPRVFSMALLALLIVALLPLGAPLQPLAYTTGINGLTVAYGASLSTQWFMMRYCPALAGALLAAAWLALRFRRGHSVATAKILLAAALGPFGFGFLRLFLLAVFRNDLVWYNTWEEFTELLFTLGVAFVLFVFRDALFARGPTTARGPGEPEPTPA
jgi:hypothetical protein